MIKRLILNVAECKLRMYKIIAQRTKQPNILLILLDDVSPEVFSCYKLPGSAKTPNVYNV